MTGPVLARILGVSRAAISQYELGQSSPSPDVLRHLGVVLGQPTDYFLAPVSVNGPEMVFFRSRAATSPASRQRGRVLLRWLSRVAQALWTHLRFPAVRFQPFDPPADPIKLTAPEIEHAAQATRRYWGLGDGPISNVVWLLENHGAIVTRGEIEDQNMDSFSRYGVDDPAPFIFLNADKASAVRSRFDAAHELGHCVLHRLTSDDYWSTDFKIALREQQANKFASAFLMPEESFGADVLVPSLETFVALKPTWRVSVGSMISRSETLGLVPEDHAARLWRAMSRRGWRQHEPLDDDLVPEAPQLLHKAVRVLTEQNPQAPFELLRAARLSAHDTAELTMLAVDTFLGMADDSNLVQFRLREVLE